MRIDELLNEGFAQLWARNKSGPVRRYRCSNGPKTGRVVAKPATCSAATKIKSSFSVNHPAKRKTTSNPRSSFRVKTSRSSNKSKK